MTLWVPRRKLSKSTTPTHNLTNKAFPRRFTHRKRAHQSNNPAPTLRIHLEFCFVIHLHQIDTQVAAGATLLCFEEEMGAGAEEGEGGGIVWGCGFEVAGSEDAELLVGFVVLTFFDSVVESMLVGDE